MSILPEVTNLKPTDSFRLDSAELPPSLVIPLRILEDTSLLYRFIAINSETAFLEAENLLVEYFGRQTYEQVLSRYRSLPASELFSRDEQLVGVIADEVLKPLEYVGLNYIGGVIAERVQLPPAVFFGQTEDQRLGEIVSYIEAAKVALGNEVYAFGIATAGIPVTLDSAPGLQTACRLVQLSAVYDHTHQLLRDVPPPEALASVINLHFRRGLNTVQESLAAIFANTNEKMTDLIKTALGSGNFAEERLAGSLTAIVGELTKLHSSQINRAISAIKDDPASAIQIDYQGNLMLANEITTESLGILITLHPREAVQGVYQAGCPFRGAGNLIHRIVYPAVRGLVKAFANKD